MNNALERELNIKRRKVALANQVHSIKHEFLSEGLSHVVKKIANYENAFTEGQLKLIDDLTDKFIQIVGENHIFREYPTKSYLLSETMKVINKYIAQETGKLEIMTDPDIFQIDIEVHDAFYKELDGLEMEDAEKVIAKRVRNNIYDYIKNAVINKEKIQSIIDDTSEKIAEFKRKGVDESAIKHLRESSNRAVNKITANTRPNPFGSVLTSMANESVSGVNNEVKLDMDNLDKMAKATYSFYETIHGIKMTEMNIDQLIRDFKNK